MSTPAKRHCHSTTGSLDSSFQKRLKKISIEGNIGEHRDGEGEEPGLAAVGTPGQAALRWHGQRRRRCGRGSLRDLFHPPLQEGGGVLLIRDRLPAILGSRRHGPGYGSVRYSEGAALALTAVGCALRR